MNTPGDAPLLDALRGAVHPLADSDRHDRLVAAIGDARVVLLGESTHGTHEFYAERARLTERLVAERGFHAVAVEAGWPDAARVNRWVRGLGDARDAEAALRGFRRFPAWLWRNTDVLAFVRWLRAHDDALPAGAPRVGFYGLDLYGLRQAADSVLDFLGIPRFAIDLRAAGAAAAALERPRPQRAIGVLYSPPATPPYAAALRAQFDAAVHVDVTTAVEPLERDAAPDAAEPPETYPSGV